MVYNINANSMYRQIQKHNARIHFSISLAAAVMMLFAIGCAASSSSTDITDVSNEQIQVDRQVKETSEAKSADTGGDNREASAEDVSRTPSLTADESDVYPTFPTFKKTGADICSNEEGRPLIYMFSSSFCAHCKWGGGTYDFIVRFLAADGLIEAHHYDLVSGDDLLTEEIETEIPADKLELYHHGNPKDLVPYYNFGCAYDRIGNGYEKENDLVAEGEEMRRVIEALVQMVSEDK